MHFENQRQAQPQGRDSDGVCVDWGSVLDCVFVICTF